MAPEELQGGDRVGPRHRVQQAVVTNLAQANRIFILGHKEFFCLQFYLLERPGHGSAGPGPLAVHVHDGQPTLYISAM